MGQNCCRREQNNGENAANAKSQVKENFLGPIRKLRELKKNSKRIMEPCEFIVEENFVLPVKRVECVKKILRDGGFYITEIDISKEKFLSTVHELRSTSACQKPRRKMLEPLATDIKGMSFLEEKMKGQSKFESIEIAKPEDVVLELDELEVPECAEIYSFEARRHDPKESATKPKELEFHGSDTEDFFDANDFLNANVSVGNVQHESNELKNPDSLRSETADKTFDVKERPDLKSETSYDKSFDAKKRILEEHEYGSDETIDLK